MMGKPKTTKKPVATSGTTGDVTINVSPEAAKQIQETQEKRKLVKEYLIQRLSDLLDEII